MENKWQVAKFLIITSYNYVDDITQETKKINDIFTIQTEDAVKEMCFELLKDGYEIEAIYEIKNYFNYNIDVKLEVQNEENRKTKN